jgi:hypothetical protein
LNTAGFAIRRARVDVEGGVFDPGTFRGEDTLLLANLMEGGELPLFVANARVEHAISLSVMGCLRKEIRSAYQEARTYNTIAAMGARIRVSHRERLSMLMSMWRASGQRSIGRCAWFVLAARRALHLIILSFCQPMSSGSGIARGYRHTPFEKPKVAHRPHPSNRPSQENSWANGCAGGRTNCPSLLDGDQKCNWR